LVERLKVVECGLMVEQEVEEEVGGYGLLFKELKE